MELFREFAGIERYRGGVVAIGNFDGVHRGHQQMIATLVSLAQAEGVPSVVLTFDPHPIALLAPGRVPPSLSTLPRKAELLGQCGVDAVIAYPTDLELLNLSPEGFFEQIVCERLNARGLVEGPNFCFGKDRAGDVDTLRLLCEQHGLRLTIVEAVAGDGGAIVSSSGIRRAIADGQLAEAVRLLGHPYRLTGVVETGARRGRQLGFPTANLTGISTLLPRDGVYAGRCSVGGQMYASAVHVGANPTFGEADRKLEVHLLDFSDDLYGTTLSVDLIDRVRDTMRFDDADRLKEQLQKDVATIRQLAATQRGAANLQSINPQLSCMIDWQPLAELLHAHERFVLTSHVRPDADAIGSEMGMKGVLELLGKSVTIVNPSATPDHLRFLDPEQTIQKLGADVKSKVARDTDVHLILDTSAWQQLADVRAVLEKTTAKKVVIDHHVSSDDLGAIEFKDVDASATGVLVMELAQYLGLTPSAVMAEQLFCAIATDTGWFRFSNTDSRTLRAAAWLIECGARPQVLYQQLYERSSLARLKLHGRALDRVEVECEGRLAHTYVLQQDFKETGAHPSDTEDLVNECLTIDGTECAVIVVEQLSRQAKVSFRSRTELDVAAIAEQFGGGGHKKASGAMLRGPILTARNTVLEALRNALSCETADCQPPATT